MPELIQILLGAALTVAVLSYLAGDNALFRLALHILVGVGAAYAVGIAFSQVLYPKVIVRLGSSEVGDKALALFGILGSVFLLAKLFRRAAWLGNVAVGYLLGVGAGVALGGALYGTLAPQTMSTVTDLSLVSLLILVATVATLLTFTYGAFARRGVMQAVGGLGRLFLFIAFGATFALVFISGAGVLSTWARDIFVWLFPPGPLP
ncbi:MAG TPA: hypothetical protein VJG32_03940 [Anaerolineae bacterium]|nr:hypothetical protein [Anaerolineae bacterium]